MKMNEMSRSEEKNYKLVDLIKFICAFLVIGIHTRQFLSVSDPCIFGRRLLLRVKPYIHRRRNISEFLIKLLIRQSNGLNSISNNLSLNSVHQYTHQPIIQPLITPTLRSASGQGGSPGSRTLRRSSTTR